MTAKARILLVDDEIIPAMLMSRQLATMGYAITAMVATGEEAVASASKDRPDLVLMDIQLAGTMDGIAAAAIIQAREAIPVIFVTGYDDREIREKAMALQPLAYLVKPLDIDHVEAAIGRYLAERGQ